LIEAGLITARFLHFAAVMALFGLALFPLYSYPASGNPPLARLSRWLHTALWCAAFLALASALAWGWLVIAAMTGTMTAGTDSLLTVLRETGFGQVWVARLALVAGILTLMRRRSNEQYPDWTIMLLAALLLASLALVGHTQTNDGVLWVVHMSADGAHLLAAGAWSGGLLALAYLLMLARQCPSAEHASHAVAALVGLSGLGYARGAHTHRVWPRQCIGAGRLAGETDHDTIRKTATSESVSAWRNAGARGANPLLPCSRAAEVQTRFHAGRGAIERRSPQRVDRADARTGDRPNRRLAGNLATRDRHVRLERAASAATTLQA